jgi:serine/threonine protein kinase/Flp pilus assembly protein TadD
MAAPPQLVGQTLSHYRIIEQIGAGGMGVVYRARDEQLERDVAVKVLPIGTLTDESARKRFRKEALALAKLNHPNIATIFEFSTQNDTDYLVAEYISGLSLDHKLAAGALSEKEVMGLGIQLAQGLGAAHEQGIVHRDLKPANLRLTSDGRLKILDFGLAQLMPHASEVGMTATLTESQEVTGTLPYMAPEQLRGEPAEARTDIWAAGAVLYETATAHRPFEQKIPSALTDDIIHTAPRPPRSLRPELSPKLEAVILKCLEKEPAHRYQSAQELQTDLERLSTGVTPIAARRQLWPILTVAAVLLALLAAGGVLYLGRGPKLTEKDTVVLADFENKTGDAVFDDTLKQGLSVSLSQSPFLNLLPDDKVNAMLKLMGRAPGDRLTGEVAREVCVRTNSKAMLAGSISSLGSQYVIGLKAVNCNSGDALAQEQATADGKERVLKALDEAAAKVRGKLGESLGTMQKFDTPLEHATTPSLEALQAYSLGRKKLISNRDAVAAAPLFQRAIGLDPNFAMAHLSLGLSYLSIGENSLAAESIRKAFQLRERVSQWERFAIESRYYYAVIGDLRKARQIYELWAQAYPRDRIPVGVLSAIDTQLGQYEKALAEVREEFSLDPTSPGAYLGLVSAYLNLNRLEEARTTAEEMEAKKFDSPGLRFNLYELAFLQNDAQGMAQQVAWSGGKPGVEDVLLANEADTGANFGHLRKARELSRQAVASAERAEQKESAASYETEAALREALFGNPAEARRRAALALAPSMGRDVQFGAALALAFAGDTRRGQALADDLAKRFPQDTLVRFNYLPTIKAQRALNSNEPPKAIEALKVTTPYELGSVGDMTLYPVYVRGQAYLAARQGIEAVAEFQKILDHRGIVLSEPIGALAHLGQARACAMSGDTVKARTAYQDFFTLWKDADPDIPILKEAKAEYAKLK